MKKKIAIIGSTGSIGKTLLDIINKNKFKFKIELLSANKDYKTLLKQSKKFKVKNLIIINKKSFNSLKKVTKNLDVKVYNNFDQLDKIFKNKIDYTMSSIIGIEGLVPTIKMIKFTKKIAIANKESIICGWNLIQKELKKNRTEFIPVDSEHFSMWYGLKNLSTQNVEKLFLTASGGPLYNLALKKFENIKVSQALKNYSGDVAVMSFNPNSIAAFAKNSTDIPVGLVTDRFQVKDWPNIKQSVRSNLRNMTDLERVGACFISHNQKHLRDLKSSVFEKIDIPILCWTIQSLEAEQKARKIADNITFEGYLA